MDLAPGPPDGDDPASAIETVARLVAWQVLAAGARSRPVVVGIGGGVAVGKSRIAHDVAAVLRDVPVGVVSTDGFLLPNAELARRDLTARKGYPESYDDAAIRTFLDGLRRGEPLPAAPLYSHETYDVVADRCQSLAGDRVVVIEGLHVLGYADRLDLSVYVDAPEAAMEGWYAERFLTLCVDPAPGTFYAGFAGLAPQEIDAVAREVWRAVNLPNLRDHILPTRDRADVVIEKRADHSIAALRGPAVDP